MSFVERPRSIIVDVSAFTEPDARTLEHLARLQLAAHRLGAEIRLRYAPRALVDLLELAGFVELLPVVDEGNFLDEPALLDEPRSGLEVDGLVEEREEIGVDEEVDPRDPAP